MSTLSGYTLTAYFNTGFNGVDIPADASVLETAQKTVYNDTYYIREDIDKPTLSVNDSYFNLRDCDYVKLTPKAGNTEGVTCYYFAVPAAAAKGVTMLSLDLDALLTMGGAKNLNYISGWEERGHIARANDTLFTNTASENFSPQRPLQIRGGEYAVEKSAHYTQDVSLVISTVDLTEVANGQEVEVLTGVEPISGDEKMYIPKITVNDENYKTEFTEVTSFTRTGSTYNYNLAQYKLPSTTAFLYENADIKEGLTALYSAGQLSLMGAYIIPKEFLRDTSPIEVFNGKPSAVRRINSNAEDILLNDSNFNFEFTISGYTIKNKKVYSMYNDYHLMNIASGALSVKQAYELYEPDIAAAAPSVIIWLDPSPTGKPLARFRDIINVTNLFTDNVAGAPWYQQQLVFEGASGSIWNSINAAFSQATYMRDVEKTRINYNYAYDNNMMQSAQSKMNARYGLFNTGVNMIGAGLSAASGIIGAGATGAKYLAGGKGAPTGYDVAQGGISAIQGAGGLLAAPMATMQSLANQDYTQAYLTNARNQMRDVTEQDLYQLQQNINENKIGLIKNNEVVSPTVMFTPSDTMSLYGMNKFVAYHLTMCDDDIIELDRYFQRYGYNGIHRPLTAQCFNERQYYNFVQAYDVNIKSSYGMRIRRKAISQLNNGVRVWKVLPDASYYDLN